VEVVVGPIEDAQDMIQTERGVRTSIGHHGALTFAVHQRDNDATGRVEALQCGFDTAR